MNKPILLVEDEEHDVLFIRIAMEDAGVKNSLSVVRDGREAMAYLSGDGKFANRQEFPAPGLVLLDLRLPRVPGLEVLKWMRTQPAWTQLPVIVYSSSDQDSDIESAYRLGANAYLVKTSQPLERLEIIRRVKRYWLDSNGPPPGCEDWLFMNALRLPPRRPSE
jgi:CheY-like chemotaxis protein